MKIFLTRERLYNSETNSADKSRVHLWLVRPVFLERHGVFRAPNEAARELSVEVPRDFAPKIRPGECLEFRVGS